MYSAFVLMSIEFENIFSIFFDFSFFSIVLSLFFRGKALFYCVYALVFASFLACWCGLRQKEVASWTNFLGTNFRHTLYIGTEKFGRVPIRPVLRPGAWRRFLTEGAGSCALRLICQTIAHKPSTSNLPQVAPEGG